MIKCEISRIEQNERWKSDNIAGAENDDMLPSSLRQEADDQSSDKIIQSAETTTTQNRESKVIKVLRKSKQKPEDTNIPSNNPLEEEEKSRRVFLRANSQHTVSPKISAHQPGFRYTEKYKELNQYSPLVSRIDIANQLQALAIKDSQSQIEINFNKNSQRAELSRQNSYAHDQRNGFERNEGRLNEKVENGPSFDYNPAFFPERRDKKRIYSAISNPIQQNTVSNETEIVNSFKRIKISSKLNFNVLFQCNLLRSQSR